MTDVSLSAEQVLLVETCARIVHRTAVRPPPPGEEMATALDAWAALVEAGLVAMRAPVAVGGAGATALDVALVVEQLARGPMPVPYLGTMMALEALVRAEISALAPAGDGAAEALAAVVAGGPFGMVLEPGLVGPAPHGVALDARPGQSVVGLGRAGGADRGGDRGGEPGEAEFVVEVVVGTAGAAQPATDLARPLAGVASTDVAVVGHLDAAGVDRWTAFALAVLSADLLGAASGALDAAVAHARERHQFGRPVGSFQAVQHLCADAFVSVEAARSITWYAAWAVDAEPVDVAIDAARVAKAQCAETALEVVEAAVQVWGGLGITWECPAHLFQRRVVQSRRLLGDEHHHHEALADRLLGLPRSR